MGDLFASPDEVVIATDGGTYVSSTVPSSGLSTEPGEPTSAYSGGYPEYRSYWWVYRPATDGTASIDTNASVDQGNLIYNVLSVYTGPGLNAFTVVAEDYGSGLGGMASQVAFEATGGATYWIRVADSADLDQGYVLTVTGPANLPENPLAVDAPPADLGVTVSGDHVALIDNDSFAYPIRVEIHPGEMQYLSPLVDNTGYTVETDEPLMFSKGRSAWWTYTPKTSGTLHLYTDNTQSTGHGHDSALAVYTGDSLDALDVQASDDDSGWDEENAELTVAVTAGVAYRIQMTATNAMRYRLRAQGPQTLGVYLDAPPLRASLGLRYPYGPVTDTLDAVPIEAGVEIPPEAGDVANIRIDAPPIGAGVALRAPRLLRLSRTLMSPLGTVPTVRPAFTVAVTQTESTLPGVYLDVQYAHTDTFTDPVTLTGNFSLNLRTNYLTLTATEDLDAGPWFWRVRLRAEDGEMPWSAPAAFTVATTAGADTVDLVWTVTDGLTQPHLWQVEPTSGATGDLITLYGQGFPGPTGTVRFNGDVVSVQAWNTVAGTDPDADDRAIDIAGGRIDAGHDEITLLMPEVTPGVGGFTVEGD